MDIMTDFVTRLSLLNIEEFLGIAYTLCVTTIVDKKPRPFEDVFIEMAESFGRLPRKEKRKIMRVVRAITKDREATQCQ